MKPPPTDAAYVAYEAIAPIYDEFCAANDYEMWTALLRSALGKHGLEQGRLLDVGCGTGRAFEPMLRSGWEVVGCDLSPAMLVQARTKFGDSVSLHQADVRALPRFGEFELVWALNDVINYLLKDGDLESALSGMRQNLGDGGLLLFDSNTLGAYRSGLGGTEQIGSWQWEGLTQEVAPGAIVESRISGPRVMAHVHRERHYADREIHAAVEAAGLELVAALGQEEVEGKVVLTEVPDEERGHKIIHICALPRN